MGEKILVRANVKSCIDVVHVVSVEVCVVDLVYGMRLTVALTFGQNVSVTDKVLVSDKLNCASENVLYEINVFVLYTLNSYCVVENDRAVICFAETYGELNV